LDERYKHMLEVNPNFMTLKVELGLDLI
jgi:hypothetical protein